MTGKSSSTTKKAAGKSKSGRNVGRLSDDSPDEMTGKSSSIAPQFLATKSPMGKTTLRLDDETRAVLSELTQRYGVTAGAVVKTALLDFVKKNRLLA